MIIAMWRGVAVVSVTSDNCITWGEEWLSGGAPVMCSHVGDEGPFAPTPCAYTLWDDSRVAISLPSVRDCHRGRNIHSKAGAWHVLPKAGLQSSFGDCRLRRSFATLKTAARKRHATPGISKSIRLSFVAPESIKPMPRNMKTRSKAPGKPVMKFRIFPPWVSG